jgi:hypothetical protein
MGINQDLNLKDGDLVRILSEEEIIDKYNELRSTGELRSYDGGSYPQEPPYNIAYGCLGRVVRPPLDLTGYELISVKLLGDEFSSFKSNFEFHQIEFKKVEEILNTELREKLKKPKKIEEVI